MINKKTSKAILFTFLFLALCWLPGEQLTAAEEADPRRFFREGAALSGEEAAKLEEELGENPDNLSARIMLLGYYERRAFESEDARKKRQAHIIWVIQNHPEHPIAGPHINLHPSLDGEAYFAAKELWLGQVEAHEENTAVLGNAARFLLLHDKDVAESLLNKAKALEPDNPEWSKRLGHLYSLGISRKSAESRREAATKALEQLEDALNLTTEEKKRFYLLSDLARRAFEAGDLEKSSEYAAELLAKAAQYENDWNYGNAIHHGNLVLGRIALVSGDVEKAEEYLLAAGETPGSPQLNSFGPNMALAKELLEKDKREVVIEYFQLCGKFWERGADRLEQWTSIVKGGQIPDFRANLSY